MNSTNQRKKNNANRKYPQKQNQRNVKKQSELDELASLEKRCAELAETEACEYAKFTDLPLSRKTLTGLSKASFVELTDIQRKGIPQALRGRDVLGAAKTGSGKTLAFLVPVLEKLYRSKWTNMDGLGALIISPTRELAIQIFQVLRKVGSEHSFSAGLIIGGKDLTSEKERVSRMNILVCTPGRMLQHMDQTVGFDCPNLQMLVLDEADRCLDLGFQNIINGIIENLPKQRQTLLFSATQTKSIGDLARLSLKDPEYVAVHEKSESATPKNLVQHYMVVPLENKLDVLWSFIKTHLTSKGIVFLSSCKQVRFVFEAFCKMHPGVPLLHIHGKQKQSKRMEEFNRFSAIRHAFLFSTDVAARGLDFPAVDWVLQVDCPEDADTYIHRVGRTARYGSAGRALLMLLPSEEEAMAEHLQKKKIPIEKIKMRQAKSLSIKQQLQALCFQEPELKYIAQKAFVSYMRGIYLQKDKAVFDVLQLPAETYAESLGLPGAPKIKFIKKLAASKSQRADAAAEDEDAAAMESESEEEPTAAKKPVSKIDKMFARQNQTVLSDHYSKLIDKEDDRPTSLLPGIDDDETGDFMTIKRKDHDLEGSTDDVNISKGLKGKDAKALGHKDILKLRKKEIKKGKNEKLIFDEDGEAHPLYELEDLESFNRAGSASEQHKAYVDTEGSNMRAADAEDRQMARDKKRAKKLAAKLRAQGHAAGGDGDGEEDEEVVVTLGGDDDDNDDGGGDADEGAPKEDSRSKCEPGWKKRRREIEAAEEEAAGVPAEKKKRKQPLPTLNSLQDEEAFALQLLGN